MSDSQEQSWSDNPNAPNIPPIIYRFEKAWFAGTLISAILYGVLIMLFFKCVTALFSPVHGRGKHIKWGLVSYTTIMFSLATVHTAAGFYVFSISYIDSRKFPAVDGEFYYGPYGYQAAINYKVITIVPGRAAFRLYNWLADGLLLYRCYPFYSMNLWVIAFPFLMFLGSVAIGILSLRPSVEWARISPWAPLAYLPISLSLNVLLTLMIVVRLVLYGRNVRTATGSPAGISGLYKAVATMLVESSAIFAVSSLLVVVTWGVNIPVMNVFLPILGETQAIASLLIIQRVANKSALTSDTVTHRSISPFKARSRGGPTGIVTPFLVGTPWILWSSMG